MCEEAKKMGPTKRDETESGDATASGPSESASAPALTTTVSETSSGPPSGDNSATQSSDDQSPPQVIYQVMFNFKRLF